MHTTKGRLATFLATAALLACSPSKPAPPTDARAAPTVPPPPPPDPSLVPPAGTFPDPSASPGPEAPPAGKDFGEEVKVLYRIAACAGEGPVPAELDAAVIDAHCKQVRPKIDAYRSRYVDVVKAYLAALRPPGLPKTVVYPFGGGDLATALTTYPDATEVTTLSLELVGDPRRVHGISATSLKVSLEKLRAEMAELFFVDDFSRSETLKKTQRGDIPGELVLFLVGLSVHGYEPVSLRYFTLREGGAIHYLTEGEIDAEEDRIGAHRKASWTPPDFSEAFANAEITFRPVGAAAGAPLRVHRHIAANLADDHLEKTPAVLMHLEAKGRVSAMTKAASYLLWQPGFSKIRDYLLAHLDYMVSDSTGIPPAFATKAGLVQSTYGSFTRSLLHASAAHNADFRKLWASEPQRKLSFRYGYKDSQGAFHLLITRRPPSP